MRLNSEKLVSQQVVPAQSFFASPEEKAEPSLLCQVRDFPRFPFALAMITKDKISIMSFSALNVPSLLSRPLQDNRAHLQQCE